MDGFSAEDGELAIGYYLGLRWFQLKRLDHGNITLTGEPFSKRDGTSVTRAECRCGDVQYMTADTQVQPWYEEHSQGTSLTLRGARDVWQPGANHARCLRVMPHYDGPAAHHVPVRKCSCGFWAYWHLGDQQCPPPLVAGLIKGSGRVIKGPLGFRCSEAEIVALTLAEPDPPAALYLEARYGVPVYYSIKGLLSMHKAPGGQPPLKDAWFCRQAPGEPGWKALSQMGGIVRTGGQGGKDPGETYSQYGRRLGLFPPAAPCMTCGRQACAEGQPLCALCQSAKTVAAAVEAHKQADDAQAALTGAEALNQLHARRESWAKDSIAASVSSIMKAFGIPGPDTGGTS